MDINFRDLVDSINDILNEEEGPNVEKMIKDLSKDFGGSNKDQMAGVQLLKGLAVSDDPMANKFMKALDKATTEISRKLLDGNKTEETKLDEAILPKKLSDTKRKLAGRLITLKRKLETGSLIKHDANNPQAFEKNVAKAAQLISELEKVVDSIQ